MKYGLMYYKETDNIGDDIQTYTAKRFLPSIDYYIDREELSCFVPKEKEYVSMIMNGWFLHNKQAWPPSPYINPLLLSMHFTQLEEIDVGDYYLTGMGGKYLKDRGPIGCRDEETNKRLQSKGIETYFSGCMTLTLQKFENVEKQDYICIVDSRPDVIEKVKANTDKEIKELTHWVIQEQIREKTVEQRMQEVEELLKTYQAASLVVTERLHVALPCLALGTPVILVHKKDYEADRLGQFLPYINRHYTFDEFMEKDIQEMINHPEPNSNKHLEIRQALEKSCEEFIHRCETQEPKTEELPDIEEYMKQQAEPRKWYKDMYEIIRVKAKKNWISQNEKIGQINDQLIRVSEESSKKQQEKEQLQQALQEEINKQKKALELQQVELQKVKEELESIYHSRTWKVVKNITKIIPKKKN